MFGKEFLKITEDIREIVNCSDISSREGLFIQKNLLHPIKRGKKYVLSSLEKKNLFLSSRPPNMGILDLILLVGAVLVVLAVLIGFCCYCLQFTGTGDLLLASKRGQPIIHYNTSIQLNLTLQLLQSPIVMLRLVCLTHPLTFHHQQGGDGCLKLQ